MSCKYAEEESVYVEDLGEVWHFHNYFDDFYVDKGGLQLSNNLTDVWAYVVAGVSFTFRGRSYSFWTDSLPLEWTAFNGSDFAVLNGTVQLMSGRFGRLRFSLNYHLVWNSSYIRITPVLAADLKYPVENVILHYRMEDISIDGSIANDFCAFLFNNENYTYPLPAYFEHSAVNITESLNHLFIYDNITWKFVDYIWEWNYMLNQMQIPVNVTLIGDGANIQADFNYGDFPLQFVFRHGFWWHDPVETRFMRSDFHTVNGLNARKLLIEQSSSSTSYSYQYSGEVTGYWGVRVFVRHEDGSETEITGGSAVAVVSRSSDGSGLQSATWNCPETSLSSTDAIVVRVYSDKNNPPTTLRTTFITEQLGASKLDAATWTIHYYTQRTVSITAKSHYTDYNSHTVNGQTHRKHVTSRDSSQTFTVQRTGTADAYCAVRWFLVHEDGSETELGTPGTYKAVASASSTGWATGTYDLAETDIAATDALKVKFYFRLGDDSFSESDLAETFISGQLGAEKLYASTLTVHYYLFKATSYWELWFGWYYDSFFGVYRSRSYISGYKYEATTKLYFRLGTNTYNSRIEGFSYTLAEAREWHDMDSLNFNITTKAWNILGTLNFSILTKAWHWLDSLTFYVKTRQWHPLDMLTFNVTAKMWHSLTVLTFNIATRTWHTITEWIMTLETKLPFPLPILVGGIIVVAIAVFYVFKDSII